MRRRRALTVASVALVPMLLLATPSVASTRGDLDEDEVHLSGTFKTHLAYRRWLKSPPTIKLTDYARAPLCNVGSPYLQPGIDGECLPPDGTVPIPGCGDDEPVEPLWRRTRPDASSEWRAWRMVIGWVCPDDLLPPFPQVEFRRLTIAPLEAHRQPSRSEVLVNKPLIVFTDPVQRVFRTDLFGFAVDVEATPVAYTWDFGDGSTLDTRSTGSPYPSQDLTHTYRSVTTATVSLTTTWTGRYRVDEDPDREWREIDGTAVTTTTLDPFDVIELRSRLDG